MSDRPAAGSGKNNKFSELELPELVQQINDELAVGLRNQVDKPLSVRRTEARRELGRYICVELSGRRIAIPLSSVSEAGDLQRVQSLPLLPSWLTGITNVRGEIISVVDLSLFFGHKNKPSANVRSFLVVFDEMFKIAITVDRIIGTRLLFHLSEVQSVNSLEMVSNSEFHAGCAFYDEQGSEIEIDLFDLNAFMSSQKLRNLTSV